MKNEIIVDFKKILSELELKKINICFLKNRGLFIEDSQKNLYEMELDKHGSYLDNLIENGIIVKFYQVDNSISMNIGDWEKEVWGILEVESFIKRQHL